MTPADRLVFPCERDWFRVLVRWGKGGKASFVDRYGGRDGVRRGGSVMLHWRSSATQYETEVLLHRPRVSIHRIYTVGFTNLDGNFH
jgi:hypothetical protein